MMLLKWGWGGGGSHLESYGESLLAILLAEKREG